VTFLCQVNEEKMTRGITKGNAKDIIGGITVGEF